MPQRPTRTQASHGIRRWRIGVSLGACLYASAGLAQTPPPLPPLPDAPAPAPAPPPVGTVQDVTILPPLPPPPVEPPPLPTTPTPTATPTAIPTATPTPTATRTSTPKKVRPRGFSVGLRFGVGIPLGQLLTSTSTSAGQVSGNLSDEFGVILPVTLDVGYRPSPSWYVGGYFAPGIGTPSGTCSQVSSQCEQNDIRFGLDAKYLFSPSAFVDPWLGAGLGWEIANHAEQAFAGNASGPEPFHVRVGLDFKVTRQFYLGPEAMFTFGVFTNHLGAQTSGVVNSAALHDWLVLGVSGHYDP